MRGSSTEVAAVKLYLALAWPSLVIALCRAVSNDVITYPLRAKTLSLNPQELTLRWLGDRQALCYITAYKLVI